MAKCKYCKSKYEQRYNSFEDACYEYECQEKSKQTKIDKSKEKQSLKAVNLKLKSIQRNTPIRKVSKTSLKALEKEARAIFQEYIRLRDSGLPCISCNEKRKLSGGHYFKCEIYSGLIFNETNCNGQCDQCNILQDGNLPGYKKGLFEKYGEEKVIKLIQSSDSNRQYKFTRKELIAKKIQYELNIKEILDK